MRTTHTTTKGSEKSPSSRAIEAAISVFLYDPLSKAAPLLPDQTTKALLSLVDDATDAADLLQALDCAADQGAKMETTRTISDKTVNCMP